ncbi:MAG: NAD(P)-dependent oxidoreductase, partial [Olsenella sp.]
DLLARCRRGVIVANGGRGDLIVTDDLVDALVSGQVGSAALDVTDPEPLPAGHPLWTLGNALVTPHVSGFWHLPVTLDNVCAICSDNLARFSRGEPLRNVVERETSPAGRAM